MKIESLSYKGYTGSAEISHEDRCLVGQILYIDDLILYEGESFEVLEKAFQSSVDEYLEFCNQVGKEPQKAYSGHFNIRIGADLHANAARKAIQSGISLNEYVRQAVQQKTDAVPVSGLASTVPIVPLDWIIAAGTTARSGSVWLGSQVEQVHLGQQRPMVLTQEQMGVSSDSATTSVVPPLAKRPTLRRIA